jgi:Family of unknown function (DUF5343)
VSLPNSYSQKFNSLGEYFDAILNAQPPERFSLKFLENLGFKSTNDRTIIGILKELGFLDADGVPKQRYYEYLDQTKSNLVLAEGIREAYSDLFAVNKDAQKLSADQVKNKLRTLYAGSKKDSVIGFIAKTFVALCELADFESLPTEIKKQPVSDMSPNEDNKEEAENVEAENRDAKRRSVSLESLQYHINIVLPESRDQAVYDAIFKSLKHHLG